MNKDNHNDFENKGWEAMLQTLDREMPVEKKRRPFLWLVFLLGLLALGSGFWYWTTAYPVKTLDKTDSKPIVETDFNKNTEGVAHDLSLNKNNKVVETTIVQNKTNDLSLNKNNKTIENNIVQNKPNDLSLIKNNKNNDNNIVENKDNDLSLINNGKATINKNEIKERLFNNFSNDNLLKKEKDVSDTFKVSDTNPLMLTTKIIEESKEVVFLKPLKIEPLSIEQDTNLKIEPQPIIGPSPSVNIKNRFSLGITTGIHTENGQKLDGFQAGLVVYKPLNLHWSWGTGLSFRQTETSADTITYFKKENIANASVSSSNLQSGTPISLDKLYYLELPLTIQYHVKKKFAFSTGLKTSYLVGQSVKSNGTAVYFVNNGISGTKSFDLLSQVNTTTLGLKRWDVSLMGGFSYLPTRHVEFVLRYDLGLANIINRPNWSAYNRYVGLNVVYMF